MPVRQLRGNDDHSDFCLKQALINRVLGNPALAVATTNTKVKTTNAVTFSIEGILYTLGASDNITVSGLTNTAAAQVRLVRVEVNTAGTVSFVEGPVASAAALALMPRRTASKATLGYLTVPASFTWGTTDATGLTYVNGDPDLGIGTLPPHDRGLAADVLTGP